MQFRFIRARRDLHLVLLVGGGRPGRVQDHAEAVVHEFARQDDVGVGLPLLVQVIGRAGHAHRGERLLEVQARARLDDDAAAQRAWPATSDATASETAYARRVGRMTLRMSCMFLSPWWTAVRPVFVVATPRFPGRDRRLVGLETV